MKNILFVDDEKISSTVSRRLLYAQRDQWDMRFASSAEAALTECGLYSFNVVVSDLRMPGMDGATLLTHVRDNSTRKNKWIVRMNVPRVEISPPFCR